MKDVKPKKHIKPPHRMGNVDDGTTVTDWMDEEKRRGISITAASVTCYWKPFAWMSKK